MQMQSIPLEQLNLSFEGKKAPLLSVDEIYDRCSQTILERCKEDRRIERKPPGYSRARDLWSLGTQRALLFTNLFAG